MRANAQPGRAKAERKLKEPNRTPETLQSMGFPLPPKITPWICRVCGEANNEGGGSACINCGRDWLGREMQEPDEETMPHRGALRGA